MDTNSRKTALQLRLLKVEQNLEKVRAKEYLFPFGSSARARFSRKWDYYGQKKLEILKQIDEER